MIIVRGDKFIKEGNKIYIVGSSSNAFYQLTTKVMGRVRLMAWLVDKKDYDLNNLEEFDDSIGIELLFNSNSIPFRKKVAIIKDTVKSADCVSLKMSLPNSIVGWLFAKLYGIPFVLESGGDCFLSLWYHKGIKHKIIAFPLELLVKVIHRMSKHIIYVSKFYLQSKYPSKARQIGCSDTVLFTPNEDVLKSRIDKIENHKGPYYLGLIGATNAEYRGHDTLIKAAALLNNKGYDVRVLFLGGGTANKKRQIVARQHGICDKVEFCGRLMHDKVLDWIDDIDILVMPTKAETLGRAVIEAMSRACPVIGTIETALREQLGSDCLVHATDVTGIVSIVELIISNKDFAKNCAYENFYRAKKYDSKFTYDLRANFYKEFYHIENVIENETCC